MKYIAFPTLRIRIFIDLKFTRSEIVLFFVSVFTSLDSEMQARDL